jgi:hypothetical protein
MTFGPSRIGPYEIEGELGRGGMGVVYRARRPGLDRPVALKVIAPDEFASGRLQERFLREAKAAAALAGTPGIVGVHDLGEDDGVLYLAMDLIEGRALDGVDRDDLAHSTAAGWVADAARAVGRAHAMGVLHRDIKPANVLLGDDGVIRVTDFGLAKIRLTDASLTRLTRSDEILGTPDYLAPEQALGDPVDGRADVYGLGAMLYELLAGRPPHHGDTLLERLTCAINGDIVAPRTFDPTIPPALEAVCLQTTEALADDLAAALEVRPVSARRTWGPGRWVRSARGRLRLTAGAALGATLCLWAGVAVLSSATEERGKQQVESAHEARTAEEQAAELSAAFNRLRAETVGSMRLLEDRANGAQIDAEDVAAALQQVEAVVASLREGPARGLAEGWKGYARFLGAANWDSPDRAELEAGSGDPLRAGMLALTWFASYSRRLEQSAMSLTRRGMRIKPPQANPAAAAELEKARAALAVAQGSGVWDRLDHGQELMILIRGAAAAIDEPEEADGILAGLGDDPLLGGQAAALRGLAAFRARRFTDAQRHLRPLSARGWIDARILLAYAELAAAYESLPPGADPVPDIVAARQSLQGAGRMPGVLAGRMRSARLVLGVMAVQMMMRHRRDFRPLARTLAEEADQLLAQFGESPGRLVWRGHIRYYLARDPDLGPDAQTAGLEDAAADYQAALDGGSVQGAALRTQLGAVRANQAYLAMQAGRALEAEAAFAKAIVYFDAAIAESDDPAPVYKARAAAWHMTAKSRLAREVEATDQLANAARDYDAALREAPGHPEYRRGAAEVHYQVGWLRMSAGRPFAAHFEAVLAALEVDAARRTPDEHTLRAFAALDLARYASHADAGARRAAVARAEREVAAQADRLPGSAYRPWFTAYRGLLRFESGDAAALAPALQAARKAAQLGQRDWRFELLFARLLAHAGQSRGRRRCRASPRRSSPCRTGSTRSARADGSVPRRHPGLAIGRPGHRYARRGAVLLGVVGAGRTYHSGSIASERATLPPVSSRAACTTSRIRSSHWGAVGRHCGPPHSTSVRRLAAPAAVTSPKAASAATARGPLLWASPSSSSSATRHRPACAKRTGTSAPPLRSSA